MAEIVNLTRSRKARARADAAEQAAQNRARFGQTKAEKAVTRRAELMRAKLLDHAALQEPAAQIARDATPSAGARSCPTGSRQAGGQKASEQEK
jgi:hypothetical protein